MRLFSPKRIQDITDIDELFEALRKRKHWKRIPERILRQIFDNARGDIEKVQRFRFVSELHHCVENNFIPLIRSHTDPRMVLAFFSVTLERLAAQAAQTLPELPDGSPERDIAIGTAEMAYMSSILCDPLMLQSYGGLAWFYLMVAAPDRAVEVCRDYEAAEGKLLSSDDSELGYYDRATKSDISEMRKMINQIKAQLAIE